MITIIGILILLLAVSSFVWARIKEDRDAANPANKMPNFPLRTKPTVLIALGIFVLTLNGMFFWANAGTAYAVQYPWGGDKMIKTQGLKTKFWGRTIPLSYEISIKDIIDEGEVGPSADGIYNRRAHLWEFSDAIKAKIGTAVVVGVNTDDEEVFLNMADRNRSESKLIYGRVLPNIDAALKNTCKLMDAQEYISGKASDFDRFFRDQLENGMYLVEEYVEEDNSAPEIIGDTSTVRTVVAGGVGNSNKQTKYRIKRDSQGNIMRDNKSNTLKQYGIIIYQAQVTGIDWENSFDERLQLQKEQVAQTQLEKQEAEKEYYRAKKEIAKGESEKAAERARLEKEQIKLTIAAETEAKVAEQNLIAEKKKYEVALYAAKSKKVAADAEAYQNAKLVSAGLTPQERAQIEKQIAIGVASELAKIQFPEVFIQGGTGNKDQMGLIEALLGAEMGKKMLNGATGGN